MPIVRDCMLRNIATFAPSTSLMEAIRRMLRQEIGLAVVLDNSMALTGLFTSFDLIKWMVRGNNLESTTLADVRVSAPIVVYENMNCQDFLKLYNQRRVRRFPVLNDDELLSGGILEQQILASMPRSNLLAHYRISDIMLKKTPIIQKNMVFSDMAKEMVSTHKGCMLICEGKKLLGVITEDDLLRERISESWDPKRPAGDFMQTDPRTIEEDRDLLYAIDFFQRTGLRRVAVVDQDNQVVGLLSQTLLLRQMADSARSRQAVLNPEDITEPAVWFEPEKEQTILALNQAGASLLKINISEWVGRPITELSEDPKIWSAIYTLLRHSGSLENISIKIRTGDGNQLCISSRFSLIDTPTGESRIFWTIDNVDGSGASCRI
ncbi:MAG: CBS domain-containing protein [Magnetococcales bacterium]|nr:CBS domain-containing protein [Magnetococcales bacterium]